MGKLYYQGRNVYIQSTDGTTVHDLGKTMQELGNIERAYFSKLVPDRIVCGIRFNRNEIERENIGLTIKVKSFHGSPDSISITGLEDITDFMIETNAFERGLLSLSDKPILRYNSGTQLVGIAAIPGAGIDPEILSQCKITE